MVRGVTSEPRPVLLGQSGAPTAGSPYSRRARAWLAYPILVVLFAFMGPYAIHPAAATDEGGAVGASAAAAASGVEEGTRTRQIAVILLAGFAVLTLSSVRRRRHIAALEAVGHAMTEHEAMAAVGFGQLSPAVARYVDATGRTERVARGSPVLLMLIVAYAGLATISFTWADDALLAAKRAVVFTILAFTAYALAQAWSLEELLYFAIFANSASLMLGIVGAIGRGDFTPMAPDYRFVGFGNPNLHGIEAACLIIATAVALRINRQHRLLFAGLLVFGIGMLLLTKSRTALLAVILASAVATSFVVKRSRLAVIFAIAAAMVFAVVVFAPDTVTHAHNAALLGRSAESDNPATLSGRTLLWEDLFYFASARPWLGYGFDSFWTPQHIAEISLRRGWVITQSHSGYIEALLNVGWIGASLLVVTLIAGLATAIRHFRRVRTPLALFAVAMMVWYMTNMLAEAIPQEHFSTLIIMVVLAHLALRSAAPDASEPDAAPAPA